MLLWVLEGPQEGSKPSVKPSRYQWTSINKGRFESDLPPTVLDSGEHDGQAVKTPPI